MLIREEEGEELREGKGFFYKVYLGSHGKQRGGCKGGRIQRQVNGAPNQMLGDQTLRVNGQYLIVHSGNYCYSSFWVTSMDENETQSSKKLPWLILQPHVQTVSLFARVKQRCVPLSLELEKSAIEFKQKQKLLKC